MANDFGIETETVKEDKSELVTQSTVKVQNDTAGKIPTLADQMIQVTRQY